jgi:hypothetical protein
VTASGLVLVTNVDVGVGAGAGVVSKFLTRTRTWVVDCRGRGH